MTEGTSDELKLGAEFLTPKLRARLADLGWNLLANGLTAMLVTTWAVAAGVVKTNRSAIEAGFGWLSIVIAVLPASLAVTWGITEVVLPAIGRPINPALVRRVGRGRWIAMGLVWCFVPAAMAAYMVVAGWMLVHHQFHG